jgi:cytochrome P450
MWVQTGCYGLRPVAFLEWCHRRYGDTFALRLPGDSTMVVLADPNAIRQVTGLAADDFTAAATAPILEPFLGLRSLVLLDGERHHRERKLLADSLRGGAMSDYAEVITRITERAVATWPTAKPFSLHAEMQAITLDVIVELIFGADDPERRAELVRVLRPWLRQSGSALLLVEAFRREGLGGRSPWGRFVAQRREVDRVLERHIEARRADPDLADRHDVLSLLLQAEARGEAFSDATSLHDQLITMLAAGHDTSATALAWAFVLLLRHPNARSRLLDELESGGDDRYLDAVVKEVLRVRPVILEVGRTLTHPVTIDSHTIPAGAALVGSILLAQQSADRYVDPRAFRPERFIEQPADPHTWLPFGGGIRRCIGAALATVEIKTVLRTVLTAVELEPVGRMEQPRRRAVTMIPSRGARAVVTGHRLRPAPLSVSARSGGEAIRRTPAR